jgi:regulator of replication initiation timing
MEGSMQKNMTEALKISTATLIAEIEELRAENERLRVALKSIASCESHHKGDVVDLARAALAT